MTESSNMYTKRISAALNSLQPIGLDEINSLQLMNRIDTKYVFPIRRLDDLISNLDGNYRVLEICNMKGLPYSTIYMDTPEYLFYHQHVRGELDRIKIRFRSYRSSGTTFLEIKRKTNKNRTVKYRIENDFSSGSFDEKAVSFLKEHTNIDCNQFNQVLVNHFTRTTLIGLESDERITLDYNISFSDTENGSTVEMPYLAVAELKKKKNSSYSPFKLLLKKSAIYPTGFSKYCVGLSILNNSVRKNRTKPSLLQLKKIENEYIKSHNS
jgi:hypothetical protein